jgi:dTDP-4-amino-4,6-dideoxygalactose transaminase
VNVPLVDLAWQHAQIADEVEQGFSRVLERTSFVLGPDVAEFEESYARYSGVRHCVGVGSGTDAIELALRALDLPPRSDVIVPANTFIATALAALRGGFGVKIVDIDEDTFLMEPGRVQRAIGPDVSAVIPVHLFGQLAPIDAIAASVDGVPIVEDAAQSQGATVEGRRSGSLGAIAATSFYPGKNLGAYGDAGAVTTNDAGLGDRIRHLRNWGSDKKYHHPEIGFNSRLDTLQAVVLSAKLARLDEWNRLRRVAAARYAELLGDHPEIVPPTVESPEAHVWHLFVVRVPSRDDVLAKLNAEGIGAGIHYPVPLHLHGAMRELGYSRGDFPVAERLADEILSLPMFPGITESQQERAVDVLVDALAAT